MTTRLVTTTDNTKVDAIQFIHVTFIPIIVMKNIEGAFKISFITKTVTTELIDAFLII